MAIEFVRNFDDLSTDKGCQFKFYCDHCGNGYLSSFETSAIGVASSAAKSPAVCSVASSAERPPAPTRSNGRSAARPTTAP